MALLKPNTVAVPQEIFDVWLTKLNESELKVLLYICRRTLGFYKRTDAVSLKQFCEGIIEKDLGTGLGKSTVTRALETLESYGLIERFRDTQYGEGTSGTQATVYRLNWADEIPPLLHQRDTPVSSGTGAPCPTPVSRQRDIQEIVQETDLQETGVRATLSKPPQPEQIDLTIYPVPFLEQCCRKLGIKCGKLDKFTRELLEGNDFKATRPQFRSLLLAELEAFAQDGEGDVHELVKRFCRTWRTINGRPQGATLATPAEGLRVDSGSRRPRGAYKSLDERIRDENIQMEKELDEEGVHYEP